MAEIIGVDRERFEQAYWRHRRAYDLGRRATDYWRETLHDLGVSDHAVLESLIDLDVQSWTRYREPMWRLARDVRAAGVKTAILANGVPEVMARVREDRPLAEIFDVVVVSYELGHAKPDREIYELTCARMEIEPAEAVFLDDLGVNLKPARAMGMTTIKVTDPDKALAELEEVVGFPLR